MKKNIVFVTLALAALVGCSKEQSKDQAAESQLVPVEVTLKIDDIVGGATRSETALFPEDENWLFDYYFVQFNADGASVVSHHERANVTMGDLSITQKIWLYDGPSTVAFIANIVPAGANYGDNPNWENPTTHIIKIADNIETYKTMKFDMAKRVAAAQSTSLKHMPMCGYWEGTITNSEANPFSMTVTLGRMISKLVLNITNHTGSAVSKVQLTNAATKAYIFPQVENTPLDDADYTTLTDNVTIANGETKTLFFYTAPNYCVYNGNVTTLNFTAGSKTGKVELVNDVQSGDCNLYMNTIYTYNVDLK